MNRAERFLDKKHISNFRSQLELNDINLQRITVAQLLDEYAAEVSREIAVEFATQIDDDYAEETPFKERLKRWGDIFDKWKSNQEDK